MDNADVISQLSSLQRRRALLDALTKQNQDTQITGNTGLGQALLKIGNSGLQSLVADKLAGQETAARRNYGDSLKAEANSYLDAFQGNPETGVKADPRAAVINAMASQLPEIQAIGKAGFGGLNKAPERLSAKDLLTLSGFDPESKVAAAMALDPSKLKGDVETVVAGDQIFNKRAISGGPVADARMTYQNPTKINGDLYQQEDRPGGKLLKLDNAPKISVSTSMINKGEDEFTKTLGKGTADAFLEARKQAEAGYRMKGTVAQLRELDKSGVFQTPVPDVAIGMGQLASALGLPVDEGKLRNSEAYRQQVSKVVADNILMGSAARSMTDSDRKEFEKTLPTLMLTPQGRQQIYSMMEQNADQSILRHQSMQKQLRANPLYKDAPGMLTFNPVDETPGAGSLPPQTPTVAPGGARKPSVSNW